MSRVAKLIEKLGLAIVGEQQDVVVEVLAAFTVECLERWDVDLNDYVSRLNRVRLFGLAPKSEPD